MGFCTQCGASRLPDAAFCTSCGAPLPPLSPAPPAAPASRVGPAARALRILPRLLRTVWPTSSVSVRRELVLVVLYAVLLVLVLSRVAAR